VEPGLEKSINGNVSAKKQLRVMNDMKPWMQEDQIKLVERILLTFKGRKINILEWGSGGSTLYFTEFLEKHNIDFNWISVEHSLKWYRSFIEKVPQAKIKVILKNQKKENPATINLDHYVHFPREYALKNKNLRMFDFILVDGRARARCLIEAKYLVKEDGVILLHDAEREKYHYAFRYFDAWEMINSNDKPHAFWITGNIARVNCSLMEKQEVYSWLLQNKKNKTPFCFSRFGDGEGVFAFPKWNMPETYNELSIKHWCEVPDAKTQKSIELNIKKTFKECDLAGLPSFSDTIMNFKTDLWCKTRESFFKFHQRENLFEMEIHLEMLQDKFFEKMIKGEKVFYVSCRNVDDILKQKGATETEHFAISPQFKYEKTKPDVALFKQLPFIEKELKNKDLTGWLCFLGAGVAGKHLGLIMRERGGMVMDIGSILDYWANVKSRTWIKKQNKL
jgi:hypothetical protein